MNPKKQRLTKQEMQKVFKLGKANKTNFFLLYSYKDRENNNLPRFRIIVNKKTSKKATERNYCKRVAGEVIKEIVPQIERGMCFILIIRKSIKNMPFIKIETEINNIMKYV